MILTVNPGVDLELKYREDKAVRKVRGRNFRGVVFQRSKFAIADNIIIACKHK